MRNFDCTCGNQIWFDNATCVACGSALGFHHQSLRLYALDGPEPGGGYRLRAGAPGAEPGEASGAQIKLCANYVNHQVCNWVIDPEEGPQTFCLSCRFTEIIPNLNVQGNVERWFRLEKNKRRLLHDLLRLGLPLVSRSADPARGLGFAFLADDPNEEPRFEDNRPPRVFTGHSDGLITVNVAEADEVSRIKMRAWMGEQYRTLLGHFRHESGHYYFDRLIRGSAWAGPFAQHFGDPGTDYEAARQAYYDKKSPANSEAHITPYASMHPWEDWAETWAHYLHMMAGLETGLTVGILRPVLDRWGAEQPRDGTALFREWAFPRILEAWMFLSGAVNEMGLSMGYDRFLYPFRLQDEQVRRKLAFVHEVIRASQPPRDEPSGRAQPLPVDASP